MKYLPIGAIVILIAAASLFGLLNRESRPPEYPSPTGTPTDPTLDAVTLSLTPESVLQGEPVYIAVDGPINSAALSYMTLGDEEVNMFNDEGRWRAIVGIGLHKEPGTYPLVLMLADGRELRKTLEVRERVLPQAEFDIPESFGGNTRAGQERLESNWESDTERLDAITSVVSPEKLWEGPFRYPLDGEPTVTDTYGYSRQTGAVNLSHNGTDFRAAIGTPVYAMNGGRVAFSGSFQNYGNTVIIDHGIGLMTMYMHLSENLVAEGALVEKGDPIARSGNTGYSLGPHLHLSVRINNLSIDPLKFYELMGE